MTLRRTATKAPHAGHFFSTTLSDAAAEAEEEEAEADVLEEAELEAKAKSGAEGGLGAEDDANSTTTLMAEAGLAAALEAEGAAEGPVLHDDEALEAEGAADMPRGAPDPGDVGASAGRSSKNGCGRG